MAAQDGIPLGSKISGLLSSAEVLHLIQVVGELCKSWTNSRQKNDCECGKYECDESDESDEYELKGTGPGRSIPAPSCSRHYNAVRCPRSLISNADTSDCVQAMKQYGLYAGVLCFAYWFAKRQTKKGPIISQDNIKGSYINCCVRHFMQNRSLS
jgi:hypothetical protein